MISWGVPGGNGHIAHAYGRKGPYTALCGSRRRLPSPMSDEHMKCVRCLRIVGKKTPKNIRERIEILRLELRLLHQQERRAAR